MQNAQRKERQNVEDDRYWIDRHIAIVTPLEFLMKKKDMGNGVPLPTSPLLS